MSTERDVKEILGAEKIGGNNLDRFSGQDTRLDNTDTKRLQAGVSTSKIIKSGDMIEVYDYQYPVRYGHKKLLQRKINRQSSRAEEYRIKSIVRAINRIRQLAYLNFTENDKFLTLTFNNEQSFDINDLSSCLPHLQRLTRHLRSRYPNLKYIVVPEFQKRGAVHYHMLINLPYLPEEQREKLWPYGFSKVLAVKSTTHLALYLSKYLSKRFDDKRKKGHRLFYTSRGLKQPLTVYGSRAEQLSEKLKERSDFKVQYQNQYKSERNGTTDYMQYLKKET